MAKLRVTLEIDSAGMNDVLTTDAQRVQLGAALVSAFWSGKKTFAEALTLGFYGIKIISMREVDDAVAITPPQPRGWLSFAALRDWLKPANVILPKDGSDR